MLDPAIRLMGKQIYLRPITTSIEDTRNIVKWRNSEVVRPYFIYQELFTPEGHEKWLENVIIPEKGYQFIVCKIEDDNPIGSTYFRDIDYKNRKSECGLFIGEETEKGKGIGREIYELMLDFGFSKLNFHKITARILSDNKASLQCHIKSGFIQEGYFKDEVIIHGKFRDIIWMAKYHPGEAVMEKEEKPHLG